MSLTGTYDQNNIFAQILRGEIPCAKVFEDEMALAFMDAFPQSHGHTLVMPKSVQARHLLDVPPDALSLLMPRVQKIAQAMVKALKPDGVILTQFNGALAGQTVFHLHFHIIPRYEGQTPKPHGQDAAPFAQLQETARAITACLAS